MKNMENNAVSLETVKQALAEVLDSRETVVQVNFTGDLSQLARLLQPEIAVETSRRGGSLSKGTVL